MDLAEEKTQFEKEGEVKAEKELVISDDELIPLMSANLFLLFFAGFDTTSLGKTEGIPINNCLYEDYVEISF